MHLRGIFLATYICLIFGTQNMNTTVYSIHYVQSFRSDVIQHNIGCEDAVAYGVYVYPNGAIDAMHMLLNGNVYGFSQMCRKKDTYYKLFGTQQDYDELFRKSATIVKEHLIGAINRGGAQALIIDWKAEPNKISKQWLEKFVSQLQGLYSVYVKAPASYFCYTIDTPYLMNLASKRYIVEMYGEENGRYVTYEDIFGQGSVGQNSQYYPNLDCPRYPSIIQLRMAFPSKEFFIEKTMQYEESGYIGPRFEEYLQQARDVFLGPVFYDSHPKQQIYF